MAFLKSGGHIIKAICATLLLYAPLSACSTNRMPMLNPVGYVGELELDLLVISTIIMALIVIPVMAATLFFAWHYRASATGRYDPDHEESHFLHAVTLFVPLVTIAILGALTWVYTHRLDPYRPVGEGKPYEIQAVSLDYKWLFIYPEEGIATINELVAPTGRSVTIRITSDPMMTSLFIPGLTSQIYAMPGMETRANFLATKTATMAGANAMYSGPGFGHQRFNTYLVDQVDFADWVKGVQQGGTALNIGRVTSDKVEHEAMFDMARYEKLVVRSEGSYPVTYFSALAPDVFALIVQKYNPDYQPRPLPSRQEYDHGVHGQKMAQAAGSGSGSKSDPMFGHHGMEAGYRPQEVKATNTVLAVVPVSNSFSDWVSTAVKTSN